MARTLVKRLGLTLEDERVAGENTDAMLCFRQLLWVAQRLRYLMDQRLRGDNLTTQQAVLLTLVRVLQEPSLTEAAAAMSTSYQNVKQLLAALERKGMLAIVVDLEDRRVRRLHATQKSARKWKRRDAADFAAVAQWFSALPSRDVRRLLGLLSRLAESLQTAD
jgi:DNA-binding MarR family transcriptional regulator